METCHQSRTTKAQHTVVLAAQNRDTIYYCLWKLLAAWSGKQETQLITFTGNTSVVWKGNACGRWLWKAGFLPVDISSFNMKKSIPFSTEGVNNKKKKLQSLGQRTVEMSKLQNTPGCDMVPTKQNTKVFKSEAVLGSSHNYQGS